MKALRRCPEVYLAILKGGRNWVALPTPEDCKGWQARKAVDGQPLQYKADLNSGEIWKVDRDGTPCKRMATRPMDKKNPKGYRLIGLTFPGSKQKTFLVHSLLCYVAHGPMPDGCSSVDHIDRNPSNNKAFNLEWSSAKQQAANKRPNVQKPLLPFVQEPGEVLFSYLGSPGFAYGPAPSLVFTSLGRIVRNGKLSQATSVEGGGYPMIGVHGQGKQKVHRLAWSAYHGPDAEVPDVINHVDGNKLNWSKENLERSSKSHNATAAHDTGAFAGGKSERQAVKVFANRAGKGEPSGVYESQCAAAKALGADQGSIWQSIRKGCAFAGSVGGVKTKLWAFAVAPAAPAPKATPPPPVPASLCSGSSKML